MKKTGDVLQAITEEIIFHCWDYASFNFHATLAGMLCPTLIGPQVVQVCEPDKKRLLPPLGVMQTFHREQLPVIGQVTRGPGA
jgi:hypothetical protein